jgi:tRNA modification GTPase
LHRQGKNTSYKFNAKQQVGKINFKIIMNYVLDDTIVALATPQGIGAIGIIRLSGNDAITICNALFKGKDLEKEASHTLHLGKITDDEEIIDEALVSLFKAPHSYTGENVVEISCHGSPYILQRVIETVIAKGARSAQAGEFTLRAFLNKKLDLSQAEAVADLIASDSNASHNLAMQQMRGGFARIIGDLRTELINFAALIELELDFSEEDVEFANREHLIALIDKLQHIIVPLIASFQLGNVIKNGVSTVIAGRPNAGKSTLLNALLQEDRAIVSEIAGTTRDTIEEALVINGIVFRLIDTAGIREATNTIEHLGITRTFEKIKQSSIIIYVFDCTQMDEEEVQKDIEQLHAGEIPVVLLANKIDLLTPKTKHDYPHLQVHYIAAKENKNIALIKKTLHDIILNNKSAGANNTIISNMRHFDALTKANISLDAVKLGIENNISGELIALDLKQALNALGTITGDIDVDRDILGTIFGKFCIGK